MKTLDTMVVGMDHHVTHLTQQKLAKKVPFDVRLKREPRNKHDRNAVKVIVYADGEFDGLFIGYVPRGAAAKLSPLMKAKKVIIVRARVVDLQPSLGEADLKIRYNKGKSEISKK